MMAWLPSALMAHLWQSTWFAAVVWLAALVLRHHSARLRYWLWAAASLKFLVPFSWLVSLGARFEWRAAPAAARPAAAFVMTEVFAPSGLLAVPDIVTHQTTTVPLVLVSVWLAGTATALFWWWRQWLPVRAALRAATPVTLLGEPDLAGLPVLESSLMFEPGVIGVRRPVLLVPAGLVERLAPAQIRALVAHERCHVHCHDNLFAAINMAVEAIFWFHPLVWWIAARQIDERERACDEAVLRAGSEPADYAEGILTVCRWSLASPVMCISGITGSDLRTRIEAIMASRIGRRLNGTGRILLALGAVTMLGGPIGLGFFDVAAQSSNRLLTDSTLLLIALGGASQAHGQASEVSDQKVSSFEVASIKPNRSGFRTPGGLRFQPDGSLRVVNMPLRDIIRAAYQLQSYQIDGWPGWLSSEFFDIQAKASGSPNEDTRRIMLRSLLQTRFKLAAHKQSRRGQSFDLLTLPDGRTNAGLKKSTVDCDTLRAKLTPNPPPPPPNAPLAVCGIRNLPGRLFAMGVSIDALAAALSETTGRPVIDRTRIVGSWTFDVHYTPDPMPTRDALPPDSAPIDPNGPSIFTALREQLGLILEARTGLIETLVIDHVERPTSD